MKKISLLVLLILFTFCFHGCNKKHNDNIFSEDNIRTYTSIIDFWKTEENFVKTETGFTYVAFVNNELYSFEQIECIEKENYYLYQKFYYDNRIRKIILEEYDISIEEYNNLEDSIYHKVINLFQFLSFENFEKFSSGRTGHDKLIEYRVKSEKKEYYKNIYEFPDIKSFDLVIVLNDDLSEMKLEYDMHGNGYIKIIK